MRQRHARARELSELAFSRAARPARGAIATRPERTHKPRRLTAAARAAFPATVPRVAINPLAQQAVSK